MIGIFRTSIIGFGLSSVKGLRRFPKPPAKITAFITPQSLDFYKKYPIFYNCLKY
jgi:hypothetical protein